MVNRSKARGTAGENAVIDALHRAGYVKAERRQLCGALDKGDVLNVPGLVIEVKNEKTTTLSTYVDEAAREAANAGEPIGVAWHKRRGRGPAEQWFVSMTGQMFLDLLKFAHAGGLS